MWAFQYTICAKIQTPKLYGKPKECHNKIRQPFLKVNLDYKKLNKVPYLSFPLDIDVSTPLRALQYPKWQTTVLICYCLGTEIYLGND